MVSGFFNQVEEAIGIKLSEPASSEQYLSSLIATGAQEGGRSYFVLLLASLIEPFSELESLDLLLPSEFGVSSMKKILFSMFYSILVGEEPDSVFLKKEGKRFILCSYTLGLAFSTHYLTHYFTCLPYCPRSGCF